MTAVARRTDPQTSWDAARAVTGIRESQGSVLTILEWDGLPMSDEEIQRGLAIRFPGKRWSPSGVRTRRSELVALGLVEDSGQRGRTASGRGTILWQTTRPEPSVAPGQVPMFR